METRGRKRKFNPKIPAHINQNQLPDNCYFDRDRWVARYTDETGRNRKVKIGTSKATLAELHKAIEQFNGIKHNTFDWLSDAFMQSSKFRELSIETKKDYDYCSRIVSTHPTRLNQPLGSFSIDKWDSPLCQNLIDQIADARGKSSANHAARYIKRLFRWGKNKGYAKINPALGIEMQKEAPKQQLVTDDVYTRVLNYARECGNLKPKTQGSAPGYIWIVLEIAYLCRLRGIEVVTITEDMIQEDGLKCVRRKGSRTNITTLNKRLKNALDSAIKIRNKAWKDNKKPIPHKPEHRPIIVNGSGEALIKSTFDSAWKRLITKAIEQGIITQQERFSPHDLKRKGTTDTQGTRADKQQASGHKSDAMMDVYDKSIAIVKPSGE